MFLFSVSSFPVIMKFQPATCNLQNKPAVLKLDYYKETFKSASRTPRFLHRNQVLNLRYFVVGSGPSLNFTALTLLRIAHKHFQVKNILVELFPLTKNHPKRSIYIMANNHLNTIAQYHTNYMFKVVLSRELIQD